MDKIEKEIYESYTTSPLVRKVGPVLTRHDVPYSSALVFNAGVTKFNGKYVMLFRNDYGDYDARKLSGTNIGLAFSDDGVHWDVQPEPCFALRDNEILRAYDPRLTVIDGRCYLCFACDTWHGIRGGIAVTDDLSHFDILSLSAPDNRNMVLFPEKQNGLFLRLDRPMPVYSRGGDRFDLWLSKSPDLRYWGDSELVTAVERVPFANDKIGPGAPPIRTSKGWLTLFHAVIRDNDRGKHGWEGCWQKMYYAGIALLDLEDPSKVIGMSRRPLIVPDQPYETDEGFRTHVIFPGGLIDEGDGSVKIYYGAADTVECLAIADRDELVKLCLEENEL